MRDHNILQRKDASFNLHTGVAIEIIIPLALVAYDMVIANSALTINYFLLVLITSHEPDCNDGVPML